MRYIFILFFSFYFFEAVAYFDMNSNMRLTYLNIINLEFDKARILLNQEKRNNPNNSIIHFNESYIDFLTVMIGENENQFHDMLNKRSSRIDFVRKDSKESPYYLYIQAEIYLQSAFLRLKFQKYINAAYEIHKAYSLLEENQKKFPDFYLNKKALGFLYIIIGSIPENYQWLAKVTKMRGNSQQGFFELYRFLQMTEEVKELKMYNTEILFLLSFLEMNMRNDSKKYEFLLGKIGIKNISQPLLVFASARLHNKLGNNSDAIQILQNRNTKESQFQFSYLEYLLGMLKLYELDYEARHHFKNFLNDFDGINYIKSAYQKLAWISLLEGKEEEMLNYLDQVRANGNLFIDEDKKAQKDAQKSRTPQITLLSSRLLYDGGYYVRAMEELQKIENPLYFSNNENIIEYWYRKGRVFQALKNNQSEMILSFENAYKKGKESSTYFSAMSALQLALEYERKNKLNLAKNYYNKCLDISGFDYQRGIHHQAKLGLSRLKN